MKRGQVYVWNTKQSYVAGMFTIMKHKCIAGMIADGESIKHTIKCTAEMHKKSLALICMLSNCIYTCLHVLQWYTNIYMNNVLSVINIYFFIVHVCALFLEKIADLQLDIHVKHLL